MKVKCYIATYSEKEVEIDDKFKALAVERSWEYNIPKELYEEAVAEIEAATGAKMDDNTEGDIILGVHDAETDIVMLEL